MQTTLNTCIHDNIYYYYSIQSLCILIIPTITDFKRYLCLRYGTMTLFSLGLRIRPYDKNPHNTLWTGDNNAKLHIYVNRNDYSLHSLLFVTCASYLLLYLLLYCRPPQNEMELRQYITHDHFIRDDEIYSFCCDSFLRP